jgi:hypothetical protein
MGVAREKHHRVLRCARFPKNKKEFRKKKNGLGRAPGG